ncbi:MULTISPECIES: branched-chain amino acid ABC transporter permease [Rhizobium/Agrobacterium group]|nr:MULTISPECIES: branched-chain amino acid ABC transporter permease [Rhizobium/Agrobacterium group]MBO9126280.1 branched-chain amino acid ABC transporter permease [Rhizobium sp. 16-488-2b]MBO9176864.1 branched-chain amino acid ABC transporter permease [Rhizobium sp. 16-488-2a]MBO9197433.1 branched-chain amino acid ABC transporter permease [Rhizobium sp. 16-449-1b]MCZ7939264.1 branched-chain amino acid ABC transporter permease [Agrobacterium salinitolerans]
MASNPPVVSTPVSALWRSRAIGLAVLVAALAFLPPLLLASLWIKVLTGVAIYTLTAAAIALLYRRLGLVSLAHVALMGAGGWVGLRLAYGLGTPFEVNMLAGGVAAAGLGMVFAYPALRMRGLYLALVTLMIAGAFAIIVNVIQFPNGGSGWLGFAVKSAGYMPRPTFASSDAAYFAYCVVVTALGMALTHWHEIGKAGRAWALIRRSEAAAMSTGVDVPFYKVWAFALSGFLAGIAGVLLAGNLQMLDARSFPAAESVMIFALTIVGGAWSPVGALIAAALYRLVPALLNDLGVNGDTAYIIFGAALIHALATAPRGIAGQIEDLAVLLLGKSNGGSAR